MPYNMYMMSPPLIAWESLMAALIIFLSSTVHAYGVPLLLILWALKLELLYTGLFLELSLHWETLAAVDWLIIALLVTIMFCVFVWKLCMDHIMAVHYKIVKAS